MKLLAAYAKFREGLAARRASGSPTEPDAKELSDLLCPPHANLDRNGHLEAFDNCIACIRVQRDEMRQHIAELLRLALNAQLGPLSEADARTVNELEAMYRSPAGEEGQGR